MTDGKPKIAETPIEIAAATGAKALLLWLDVIPTVNNPNRTEEEHERAERFEQILAEQIEAIKRARADQ